MPSVRRVVLLAWCVQFAVSDAMRDGTAAAAVGNAIAFSSNGMRYSVADGWRGPSADSSGNGRAFASDGRNSVSSVNGYRNPAYSGGSSFPQYSDLTKYRKQKKSQIPKKYGPFAYAGGGFNPFAMVGLPDPRLMLGRR